MGKNLTTLRQVVYLFQSMHFHWWHFLAPVALSLIAAAFEGVGMGLLIPMLEGFLSKDYSFIKEAPGLSVVIAWLPEIITSTDRWLFASLIGFFVIATLLKNVLRYLSVLSISYLAYRSVHHLRKLLFTRYMSFGKLYFDQSNVGHHSVVLSEFSAQALKPLLTVNKYINALFSTIVYLVVMTLISWKLTLFALPLLLVLHLSVKYFIEIIHRLSNNLTKNAKELSKKTIEILSLIPLVQSYNMEEGEKEHYKNLSDQRAKLEFHRSAVRNIITPLQETLTLAAMIFLFSGMLYLMVRDGVGAAPPFIIYFYLVMNAAAKFGTLTGFRGDLANASAPVEAVLEILDDDGKYFVPSGSQKLQQLNDHIEFKHLNFSFSTGKEVLHDLHFRVEKGKMTAIVGQTGAGKTTIINLLLRFYDCPPESVFLDEIDIRNLDTASIRSHIALVSQDTQLLHDSLKSNITYGLDGITDEQFNKALRQARLSSFVEQLPNGSETLIGDRGVKLSGGEKQRVSIARALLKGVDIIILDEATSSLDSQTEKLIQEAIDDAIKDRTAIVIAHRLSTIKHADKIVVIEKGYCIEEGTLEQLLSKKGKFYGLWEEQKFN